MTEPQSGLFTTPAFLDDSVREGQLLVLEQIAAGDSLASVLATLAVLIEQADRRASVVPFVVDSPSSLVVGAPLPPNFKLTGEDLAALHAAAIRSLESRRQHVARPAQSDENSAWAYGVDGPSMTVCTVPVLGPDANVLGVFAIGISGEGEAAQVVVDLANQYAALASVAIRTDQRERSLERSQRALDEAQRIGRFGDLTVDLVSRTMAWSERTFEIYGLEVGPPPSVQEFVAWHEGAKVLDLFAALSGEGPAAVDLEVAVRRGDDQVGHRRFVLSRRHGIGERVLVTGTVHDVTDRRRTEDALAQAQRLESLGLLAGGIAHDFNNLLAAMLANVGLLERHVSSDPVARRIVASMDKVVHRAAELTRQILTYAGRAKPANELVALDALVSELASIIQGTAHERLRLALDLGADDAATMGDPAQLQQVVLNLLTNAIDAIGDAAGNVVVRTRSLELTEEAIQIRFPGQGLSVGPYIELSVADDGCGMSAETAQRIFDPFFTTKVTGRGLGLSAVRGILKAHGAAVSIDSAVGRGTTFRLVFPERRRSTSYPPAGMPLTKVEGRLLLVDDEDSVREAMRYGFEDAGYTVEAVADGARAIELIESGTPFDVVVSDLRMPRVTGLEVYAALRARSPRTPFVMCTGFRGDADLHRVDVDVRAAVVEKPARVPDLRAVVERMRARP